MYCLIVFVSEESGCHLSGCLWLRFSHEVVVRLSAGAVVSSEGVTKRGSSSKLTLVAVGRIQFLAGHWTESPCLSLAVDQVSPSVPCHESLSVDCPQHGGCLASQKVSRRIRKSTQHRSHGLFVINHRSDLPPPLPNSVCWK